MTKTAEQLRAEAQEHRRSAHESFERCDTDGFVSQWASSLHAQLADQQAAILENGGVWDFPALFRADTGERVKARLVHVRDRWRRGCTRPVWLVLDSHNGALRWINAFPVRESTMARKGFREGREDAPARAYMDGEGHGLSGRAWVAVKRTDAGYPEGAVVYGGHYPNR